MLMTGGDNDPRSQQRAAVFREELAKLGWVEGRSLRTDARFIGDDIERARALAAEIASLAPDVLLAESGTAIRAIQGRAPTTPIVYIGPGPESGLVKNIARPEGNLTGFPILYPSIAGKWLELLKEADPRISRVVLIYRNEAYLPFVEEAAAALGVKVGAATTQEAAEIERTVDAFATEPNGAVIVMPSAVSSDRSNHELIRRLAERHRLPTIH
jgi:putative ABC transport system substrate-binding protein